MLTDSDLYKLLLLIIKTVRGFVRRAYFGSSSQNTLPISTQEKLLQMVSRSPKASPSEENSICYISCTDKDRDKITSIIALLEEQNMKCIMPSDFELGENVIASTKRDIKRAQKCLVVLTSDYCNAIKEIGSTISREYHQIYDELSTTPESTRFIPIFVGDIPDDIPQCLKNKQGISLTTTSSKWIRILRAFVGSLLTNQQSNKI